MATKEEAGLAIRRRMRELGLSQPALGRMIGKSHSWVNVYLLEKPAETIRKMWAKNPQDLDRLLRALQWTSEEFTRATGIELPGAPLKRMGARPVTMTTVPFHGVVSAGRGTSHAEPMGEIEVPSDVVERYGSYGLYALEVDGDSMFCEDLPYSIPPGSFVVVARDLEPRPGDLVIAWLRGKGVGYLKELEQRRGHQVLKSWNPEVPPLVVSPDDEVEIQGVVVHVGFDPRKVRR